MKFVDFVSSTAIRPNLAAGGKEDVIREMTLALVESGDIQESEAESTIKAITKREELGSTGIGRGVAVPHTKHPSVDRLVGTVGVSVEGVDFKSLDGEKVNLFFLTKYAFQVIILGLILILQILHVQLNYYYLHKNQ